MIIAGETQTDGEHIYDGKNDTKGNDKAQIVPPEENCGGDDDEVRNQNPGNELQSDSVVLLPSHYGPTESS